MTGETRVAALATAPKRFLQNARKRWEELQNTESGFWRAATVAAFVVAAVTLRDVGLLLSKLTASGQSFGAGVFTGVKIDFWDVADLRAAVGSGPVKGVWEEDTAVAATLLRTHFAVDLVFAFLLSLLLAWMLRAVAGPPARPQGETTDVATEDGQPAASAKGWWIAALPFAYLVADWAETLTTWVAVGASRPWGTIDLGIHPVGAGLVHLLSDAKWLVLLANVLAIVTLFLRSDVPGTVSLARLRAAARQRSRDAEVSVGAPGGVVAVVVVFAVLIALPGGGPLDQFPDVLRVQFDHLRAFVEHPIDNWPDAGPPMVSGLTLAFFALLVYVTVSVSMIPNKPHDVAGGTRAVLAVAAGLSAALFFARGVLDASDAVEWAALPTAAPLVVVLLLASVAWFIGQVRTLEVDNGTQPFEPHTAVTEQPVMPDAAAPGAGFGALVVGLVVLSAAAGGVRALLPVVLVRDGATTPLPPGSQSTPIDSSAVMWLTAAACLALSYLLGVFATAATTVKVRQRLDSIARESPGDRSARGANRKRLRWALYAAFAIAAGWLAVDPSSAGALGATGTTTVALGGLVVAFAGLGSLTRHWRWASLSVLGGRRTSWAAIVMAVWLMASQLDLDGGYHDARTLDVPEAAKQATQRHRTLDTALTEWFTQTSTLLTQDGDPVESGCLRAGRMPMVFLAAPGGGARAMYWTVAGMDRAFAPSNTEVPADDGGEDGFCPASLFAASGVSGGAVGLTTRLSVAPDEDAVAAADAMSAEGPLAATIAAMLLRDLPQPFTGMRSTWRDRAAVLETQWKAAAASQPHEADAATPAPFASDLGGTDGPSEKVLEEVGQGWWAGGGSPVVLLNGTSVSDGCRVIVGNVHGLAGLRKGCLDAPDSGANDVRDTGLFSATHDVLAGLAPATGFESPKQGAATDQVCGSEDGQTLYATTAALLAARFPYVTPSGALRRCPAPGPADGNSEADEITTTYVVDGGYLENTGLLSLTQTWRAISNRIEACNELATSASGAATASPGDESNAGATDTDANTVDQRRTELACPTMGARAVEIEPWVVLLENHYGSEAAPPRTKRTKELFVPPATAFGKRAVTTGTVALEQAAVADMTGAVGGEVTTCNRFIRLSPSSRPGVEAPLGWVLSYASKASLQAGLETSVSDVLGGRAFGETTGRCA